MPGRTGSSPGEAGVDSSCPASLPRGRGGTVPDSRRVPPLPSPRAGVVIVSTSGPSHTPCPKDQPAVWALLPSPFLLAPPEGFRPGGPQIACLQRAFWGGPRPQSPDRPQGAVGRTSGPPGGGSSLEGGGHRAVHFPRTCMLPPGSLHWPRGGWSSVGQGQAGRAQGQDQQGERSPAVVMVGATDDSQPSLCGGQ